MNENAVEQLINRAKQSHSTDIIADSWDWYSLSTPSVIRRTVLETGGIVENIKQRYSIPDAKSKLPLDWRRVEVAGYSDVQWTYSTAPSLSCNGIAIKSVEQGELKLKDLSGTAKEKYERSFISLQMPKISIFDNDAIFPLNLTRNSLSQNKYPFFNEVSEDVIKDLFAFILVNGPTQNSWENGNSGIYNKFLYPGLESEIPMRNKPIWFCNKDGFSLLEGWNAFDSMSSSFLILPKNKEHKFRNAIIADKIVVVMGIMNWGDGNNLNKSLQVLPLKSVGIRLFMRKGFGHQLVKRLGRDAKIDMIGSLDVISVGNCTETRLPLDKVIEEFNPEISKEDQQKDPFVAMELYYDYSGMEHGSSFFAKKWKSILGSAIVPYDISERRRLFSHAYDELKDYINAQEELRNIRESGVL